MPRLGVSEGPSSSYLRGVNHNGGMEPTKPLKAVLYARASTDDQVLTIEAQRAKLLGYSQLFELDVVDLIEANESAKDLNRPGLQRALGQLRSGAASILVVTKLDRLARNVGDWQSLIDGYFGERAGKQLISVSDSVDSASAGGRLALNMMMSVAAWEREVIAERTKAALAVKIKRGERVGAIRYGYDLAEDGIRLVENEREQATIRVMVALRRGGMTLRGISDELYCLGLRPRSGVRWSHRVIGAIVARSAAVDV